MRALVISGGGSKGAFAGGVAQFLLEQKKHKYNLLVGTSTGSLLIPHLALGKIDKIHDIYTNVNKSKIFNVNPFVVKRKNDDDIVTINHFNVIKQFFKGKRTFGESYELRKFIKENLTIEEYNQLRESNIEIVITVTNFSLNKAEYKSIFDYDYDDFCDWIWISCNYVPFMSLVTKNGYEYGDGGFSSLVPVREALNRGARIVDVIILETEIQIVSRSMGKNPFSLLVDLFQTLLDQVEKHNITIGKLSAKNKDANLNLYYTPTQLTNNALIFDNEKMKIWWSEGYEYAKNKSEIMSENIIG
jgi:NTE family protein